VEPHSSLFLTLSRPSEEPRQASSLSIIIIKLATPVPSTQYPVPTYSKSNLSVRLLNNRPTVIILNKHKISGQFSLCLPFSYSSQNSLISCPVSCIFATLILPYLAWEVQLTAQLHLSCGNPCSILNILPRTNCFLC